MCLQPSCFGNIDLNMAFDYKTHGKTFTFNVLDGQGGSVQRIVTVTLAVDCAPAASRMV